MIVTPRYDEPRFLQLDLPFGDPAVPMLRQRHRLAVLLADLDEQQWATASRCEGWSVQDVIAHLVTTNQFWAFSIASALGGEPSRYLAGPAVELLEALRFRAPLTCPVPDGHRWLLGGLAEVFEVAASPPGDPGGEASRLARETCGAAATGRWA